MTAIRFQLAPPSSEIASVRLSLSRLLSLKAMSTLCEGSRIAWSPELGLGRGVGRGGDQLRPESFEVAMTTVRSSDMFL